MTLITELPSDYFTNGSLPKVLVWFIFPDFKKYRMRNCLFKNEEEKLTDQSVTNLDTRFLNKLLWWIIITHTSCQRKLLNSRSYELSKIDIA